MSIISEDQAERIGEHVTGGRRGTHFKVFSYAHRRSNLTMFGIELLGVEHHPIFHDPRAAASAQPVKEK